MSKKNKVKKKCCDKPPRKRCKRCPRNQDNISNEAIIPSSELLVIQ